MEIFIVKLQELGSLYGIKMIASLAILILGRIGAGILRRIIIKLMKKSNVDETLISFVGSVTYVTLMAFIIIAALGKLGMQTASFVAILGAAGLAIGLALQGSLANFASGVLIIIFKPIKVGDYVEGGGVSGVVEEIGIFTTEMVSVDNKKIIVPNVKITGDNIINYSAKETRRVDILVGISYKDDIDKVKLVLERILSEEDRVLQEPIHTIAVAELGASSVNLTVRSWVKTADYWDVYFALQEKIKKRFDMEGISIPFPQQDVNLYKK